MPKKSIRGRKTIVIAAILAAAVVAIPTSAYAVNRIYQASIQSTGSYQKDVVIDAGDSTLDTRTQSLQVGWMPDGMTLDKSSGKYHDDQNRGVTMLFWKMQDGDFLQTVNRGIVHSETETINGNQVFFLQRAAANLPDGQMDYRNIVWVAFSNTPYAAQFYATDDLTKEELTQIAEHLSLSPAEQETASLWQPEESLIESSCSGLRCQSAFVCQYRRHLNHRGNGFSETGCSFHTKYLCWHFHRLHRAGLRLQPLSECRWHDCRQYPYMVSFRRWSQHAG